MLQKKIMLPISNVKNVSRQQNIIKKSTVYHHYFLTFSFFVLACVSIAFLGHLINSFIKYKWFPRIFYLLNFAILFVFTNRCYWSLNIRYKYIAIVLIVALSALPFLYIL